MPQPLTPARIQAARAATIWVIRALSLAMITWAVIAIGARLAWGTLAGSNLRQAWLVYTGIGEHHGIFLGVPTLAVGIALALLSNRLAVWIIRAPAPGCPRCGYADPDADTCPECGQPDLKL